MSKQTIETFFAGKMLVVPGYQRDYAWRERNINELLADVEEALEGGGHYLGTFILSQSGKDSPVYVVDGQQRLTTLTMVLDALINALTDDELRTHYRNTYIRHPVKGPRFKVLGDNEGFFAALLSEQNPVPESAGQQRLLAAYEHIRLRVHALKAQSGANAVEAWLQALAEVEVLEFVEPNEGKAIRMFQSVNDRGVPLARTDIVKSLLVYYSNRYLGGELDSKVSIEFGKAFKAFSRIKTLSGEPGYAVRLIDRAAFSEDDVLRYHYFAFDGGPFGLISGADYNATSESVLETFLKPALQSLRQQPVLLRNFIENYCADLRAFFEALEMLLLGSRKDRSLYMVFVVQDLSATLYPLIIRLQVKGWLNADTGTADRRDLLALIEMADLRVFKLRGTNPQADIFALTRELPGKSPAAIATSLQEFGRKFMPDHLMQARLVDEDLYRNPGVQRMLWEQEDHTRLLLGQPNITITDLVAFNRSGMTVEHILPQDPGFNIAAFGFESVEQYELYKHRIGNLVLLEGHVNSACQNKSVQEKMSSSNLYSKSGLKALKAIAAAHTTHGHDFNRNAVEVRGQDLAKLMLARWPIEQPCQRSPDVIRGYPMASERSRIASGLLD